MSCHGRVQEKRNALEDIKYAMEYRIVEMVKMKKFEELSTETESASSQR